MLFSYGSFAIDRRKEYKFNDGNYNIVIQKPCLLQVAIITEVI